MTIFEKIIKKEIFAKIIYEDQKIIAIEDIKPQRPGHFLVIPKTFSTSLIDIKDHDLEYLFKIARKLALQIIKKLKVKGFNLIVNNGKSAGQEIMYTHIHIIPALS